MTRVFVLVLLATLCASAQGYTNKPFGEYYPHTRWIDSEKHSIRIDAYPDRLVIARRGKPVIVVRGCWRGRAFLRDCRSDYFGVAHEGIYAAFFGESRFGDIRFRRVRPDPKT
jgi:hypothetical protein